MLVPDEYMNCCTPVLYADDAYLIIKRKTQDEMVQIAEEIVANMSLYLENLNLIVNATKTNFITFEPRGSDESTELFLCDCKLERLDSTKFLGMIIDKNLSWQPHIVQLTSKLRKGIFIIKQLAQTVSYSLLLKSYYAFVNSHLSYGALLWGGASKERINWLFVLQKCAIRILTTSYYLSSCRGTFKTMKILTVVIYLSDNNVCNK